MTGLREFDSTNADDDDGNAIIEFVFVAILVWCRWST